MTNKQQKFREIQFESLQTKSKYVMIFLLINVLIIGQAFAVPRPKIDSKSFGSAEWSYDGINGKFMHFATENK